MYYEIDELGAKSGGQRAEVTSLHGCGRLSRRIFGANDQVVRLTRSDYLGEEMG